MSSENTARTSIVTIATFAAAEDLERATMAVFRVAADRREEAGEVLAALQCRKPFSYEDEILGEPEFGTFVVEDECLLPTGHSGDHAPSASDTADPLEYRAAVTAYRAAAASAHDALEAWEDAQQALHSLSCRHVPETHDGLPCVLRRGHAVDVPHVHPTTIRIVY